MSFPVNLRKIPAALALLILSVSAFAQISLKIESSHANYLQYDAVYVKMLLHNYSSIPITFGTNEKLRGELNFMVEKPDGTMAVRMTTEPLIAGIIIDPGQTRTITFNLARHYSFQQPGKYTITASMAHPQFKEVYGSNTIRFNIRKGNKFWERKIGIPEYRGKKEGDQIRTRNYKILTFFDGKNNSYYLQIEDSVKVYFLKRIGFDMGPDLPPQIYVDKLSRLHIMLAASHKVFVYYIYNHEGKMEDRKIYVKTSTTPYLVSNPANGSVFVDGGRIARKDVDYEEIEELPIIDDAVEVQNSAFERELPSLDDIDLKKPVPAELPKPEEPLNPAPEPAL